MADAATPPLIPATSVRSEANAGASSALAVSKGDRGCLGGGGTGSGCAGAINWPIGAASVGEEEEASNVAVAKGDAEKGDALMVARTGGGGDET